MNSISLRWVCCSSQPILANHYKAQALSHTYAVMEQSAMLTETVRYTDAQTVTQGGVHMYCSLQYMQSALAPTCHCCCMQVQSMRNIELQDLSLQQQVPASPANSIAASSQLDLLDSQALSAGTDQPKIPGISNVQCSGVASPYCRKGLWALSCG